VLRKSGQLHEPEQRDLPVQFDLAVGYGVGTVAVCTHRQVTTRLCKASTSSGDGRTDGVTVLPTHLSKTQMATTADTIRCTNRPSNIVSIPTQRFAEKSVWTSIRTKGEMSDVTLSKKLFALKIKL
jgi:hypothetical protein